MKRVNIILFSVFLFVVSTSNVNASSWASINSNNSVVQGNSITITATVSSNSAIFFIEGTLQCNGAGVNKSIDLGWDNMDNSKKSNSKSITVTPSSTGTITCKISGRVSGAEGGGWQSVSTSKKINVVKPREKSTNINLKALSIEGYEITPEFNKDQLEYEALVADSVEKININATLEDSYATVIGAGEQEVVEGANKFEIKVTSETGVEKVYTLNVNVKDNNPIEKSVNNKTYTIVKRASSLTIPEGYTEEDFTLSKIIINELEIPVLYNESLNIMLIGLKDDRGNIYLYKTDENGNINDLFETITSKSLTVLISNPKEEIEGYTKTTVTIKNKDYEVYQGSNKNYALIYGTNLNTNEEGWFLYNIKENSMQAYISDIIDDLNNDHNKKIDEYKAVVLALSGLSLILLIIILLEIRSKNKLRKKRLSNTMNIGVIKEEPKKKKDKKKREKVEELTDEDVTTNQDDFLDTTDIEEIFDNHKEDLKNIETLEETANLMVNADDFLDKKKKKKKK